MVSRGAYCRMSFPRQVTFDATTPQPAKFLARLLLHALNHGMPASRRGGRAVAVLGRRDLPADPLARGLRALPRRRSPHLDDLMEQVAAWWPELTQRARHLPTSAPRLSALEMDRSAARTVFVFGPGDFPLLVIKTPHEGHSGPWREARALQIAAESRIAPAFLGQFGGALVQEGLPGMPLRLRAVTSTNAAHCPWPLEYDFLVSALQRLAQSSVRRHAGNEQLMTAIKAAQQYDLPARYQRLLSAASRDLSTLKLEVLQHRDLSAQNWLVDSKQQLVGVVDWEMCQVEGTPGFDAMHAAVSNFEHGIGLARWSEQNVLLSFRRAWSSAPLFSGGRNALKETARAAGVREALLEPLELGFFARRLGRRLFGQSRNTLLSPRSLSEMLTIVCDS